MTYILETHHRAFSGAAFMVLAGALFAGANVAVQAAGMWYGAPSSAVAFWQYAGAMVLALPLLRGGHWRTGQIGLHLLRVALAAIGVQFWVAGLAVVPIWQAIALILTSPLFVTIGAWALLGERLDARRIGAVLLGALGGVIILAPWADDFTLAAFLPVIAAAFWAGASLLTKRLAATETAATLTLALLVLLVPINLALALPGGLSVGPVWWPVLLAAGCTVLAQWALAVAYRRADATYLQPFDHLKLPFNVALGFAVFGFAPPGSMWLGAALIILAVAWVLGDRASASHKA